MTNTSTDREFASFIDACVQSLCLRQAMELMASMLAAAQPKPYRASPESAAATRQALGATGLSHIPGTRSRRLSAAERAREAAKAEAAKWGFVR